MTLKTRKPTGKPPWPILLLAGAEKAGKSWAAAQASSSDLIGRAFWISVGEDDPDEYGAIPGASFEIVLHDGTYRGILQAIRDARAEPWVDGLPTLITLDSGGRVWELLKDMASAEAYQRAEAKARKFKKPIPKEDEIRVDMDMWNIAAQRWDHIMNELRVHEGPSIITARLDVVTVMDADGKPTKEKTSKVQAHKSLPFDVGVVVEMPGRGEAILTGLRSVKFPLEKPRDLPGDWTVDWLWRKLGLAEEGATTVRQHASMDVQASVASEAQEEAPSATPAPRAPTLEEELAAAQAARDARNNARQGPPLRQAQARSWDALVELQPEWTREELMEETVVTLKNLDTTPADASFDHWTAIAEDWERERDEQIKRRHASRG